MSEPNRTVLVLCGRVEAPELRAVLSRALRALRDDPGGPVYVNCGGVVSLTGDALLMLAWACRRCAAAGVALRLVEFPDRIMATAADRLAEAVTKRMAEHPGQTARPWWGAAYSLN